MAAKGRKAVEVTVTYLEMNARPARHVPLPLNRHVALLAATNVPLHFYRYLQDRVGRDWTWVNALRLSDEELSARLASPACDMRVLYVDGVPAGFFELKLDLSAEVEIAYFGLMEHAAGQGLGRWFLGAAIEVAWEHNPAKVVLQTCTLDHPAALPLYQKMGFSPVGQARETLTPLSKAERASIVMR
ncbi:GNAT family N-acetyltransferase [Mesorhizobium sp. Z1-4]|uniref:GNAT family N-acetyltransferase n=1 Tax=Mesorhizobium sp. Z1-4 TaxID=2448478 RepID=UPI000FD74AFF|nr:GNAT family N-acetyltransferase [Mesorhizobium sp. Z1-4]